MADSTETSPPFAVKFNKIWCGRKIMQQGFPLPWILRMCNEVLAWFGRINRLLAEIFQNMIYLTKTGDSAVWNAMRYIIWSWIRGNWIHWAEHKKYPVLDRSIQASNISEFHLNRMFSELSGQPSWTKAVQRHIELLDTNLKISDIARCQVLSMNWNPISRLFWKHNVYVVRWGWGWIVGYVWVKSGQLHCFHVKQIKCD